MTIERRLFFLDSDVRPAQDAHNVRHVIGDELATLPAHGSRTISEGKTKGLKGGGAESLRGPKILRHSTGLTIDHTAPKTLPQGSEKLLWTYEECFATSNPSSIPLRNTRSAVDATNVRATYRWKIAEAASSAPSESIKH